MPASPIFNPDPSLYPDPTGRAARIARFIKMLTLWEGDFAGERFYLHPFQRAILNRIYGPVDANGRRIIRQAAIWIPRGNAKTTLASALALTHFMGPEAEPGGQIICAAADRGNAGIAFNSAFQFTQQDPVLKGKVRPVESQKFMTHPGTNSILRAISTEAYSKHGMNVSLFIADEIHVWPPTEARKLFGVVSDSMVKRSEPLTIVISTAGEGDSGLAYDLWEYSHKVALGEIDDPSFAPIIFETEPGVDWLDERIWRDANPGIDAGFVFIEELRNKSRKAAHFPSMVVDFKRYHLNMWAEGAASPRINIDVYDGAEPARTAEELLGCGCYIGIDLSSIEDLTAVVALFPDAERKGCDVLSHFFLPEDSIQAKSDKDQTAYLRYVDEGRLTLTPGNRIDQRAVKRYVADLHQKYSVLGCGIDRWNSTAFVNDLSDDGIEVVEYGQGMMSMAGPVREIISMILGHEFRHGGNGLLRSCFANAVTVMDDAGNEKFTKAKSRGRIDGAVASAIAVGLWLKREEEEEDDVYSGFYSRATTPKVKSEAEVEAEKADNGEWDPEIIRNPRHPEFKKHAARYNRWHDRQAVLEDV